MNEMQKNLSKESIDETRGPCQTGSFMMSLLHPQLLRCKLVVGVFRQMGLMINSRIVIKAKRFYQLMNKCHSILCFWHKHFLFSCLLASMQLETIWASMPSSTTKVTQPLNFVLFLSYRMSKLLRFGVT